MPEDMTGRLLARARAAVVKDPEIVGGEPVLKGTRMPVFMVADMRSAGMALDCILAEYPSLTAELVEFAVVYAAKHQRPELTGPSWRNQPPLRTSIVSRRPRQ